MNWGARLSEKQKDFFSVAVILGIFIIRFFRTIFLGHPVSRIFLLTQWDSLFYNLKMGHSISMDPSLVQVFIPYKFLIANYWHHALPLWNQWSGFGMPLLADPQARVFSPLSLGVIMFPGLVMWNFLLIVQLAIGAVSTYYLVRKLELDFVAAFTAALLFTFCPWLDWQLELMGKGICFTPLVFLFFARLAKKGSFKNIALAGIVAAIEIFSCHPEIAFITLVFASLFTCLLGYYDKPECSLFSSLRVSILNIFLVALITFGLCAPMFIPFLEYALNADSYKLDAIASSGLSGQAIFANFLYPFQGSKGSIFFGALSILGVSASLCFLKDLSRCAKPLLICLLLSILAVVRPAPFDLLFNIPPFSMTFATYWLPEYFLLISIISGMGCSYLIKSISFNKSARTLIFYFVVLTLCFIPLLYSPWHNNCQALIFDSTFESPKFVSKIWLFNTLCLAISLLTLLLTFSKSDKQKFIGSIIFIALGLLNLFIISFNALPITPNFKYPDTLPLNLNSKDIKDTDRILSIGDHLLRPNTNLVYRLPLLQTANPIFPKGFIEFVRACGAQADQYTQIFPPIISPLLKLSGVNTIISEQPILDESVLSKIPSSYQSAEIKYTDSITLSNIKLLHNAKDNSIFLIVQAKPNKQENSNYHLCLGIEDFKGNPLSHCEPVFISASQTPNLTMCSGIIPKDAKNWIISIRTLRDKDCSFLKPENVTYGSITRNNSWILASSSEPKHIVAINNSRFKLIAQQGSLLRYQDTTAFNRYFFVENLLCINNKEKALDYLKTHTNELDKTAVIEENSNNISSLKFDRSAQVKSIESSPNNRSYSITPSNTLIVNTNDRAFLVASDIYYPGWQAYIDGKHTKIFRTDSLFRGIIVPAGKHIIKFVYQPLSVLLGIILFISTLTLLIIFPILKRYKGYGNR